MIDSAWCGHGGPLQYGTEIAGVLQVLNKIRSVQGSAVSGAGRSQKEGATGRDRALLQAGGNYTEIISWICRCKEDGQKGNWNYFTSVSKESFVSKEFLETIFFLIVYFLIIHKAKNSRQGNIRFLL